MHTPQRLWPVSTEEAQYGRWGRNIVSLGKASPALVRYLCALLGSGLGWVPDNRKGLPP